MPPSPAAPSMASSSATARSASFASTSGSSSTDSTAAAAAAAAAQGAGKPPPKAAGSNLSTLFTGIIFGLQPDALYVIIPALALPTKLAAIAYILMFVFGTVAAMGSYTAFIGALYNCFWASVCSVLDLESHEAKSPMRRAVLTSPSRLSTL